MQNKYYHYRISSIADSSDIWADSGLIYGFKGYETEEIALTVGEDKRYQIPGGYKDQYQTITYPATEV